MTAIHSQRLPPGKAAMNQAVSIRKAMKCSSLSNCGMGNCGSCGGSGVSVPHRTTASPNQPSPSHSLATVAARPSAMGLAVAGITDHVCPLGRREMERIVAHRHVALYVVEVDTGGIAQVVLELHHRHVAALETELDALEIRVLDLGREAHPGEAVLLTQVRDVEALLYVVGTGEQHRRARRQGVVERLDR